MEFSLDRLRAGQCAIVVGINVPPDLACQLKAYGLAPNARVCCRYRSRDGKVQSLSCRGGILALRLTDSKRIWVRKE